MRVVRVVVCCLLSLAFVVGCSAASENPKVTEAPAGGAVPPMPAKVQRFEDGVPVLSVYVKESEKNEEMTLEDYLAGVLAGEMKNDWPLDALKAQAILARTFVLRFMTEKESKYDGADISTDIEEAQAYDKASVNDAVRQAVSETRGMVLSSNGELPYAWFHAHSGGMTELAKEGLNWKDPEPPYTRVTQGYENEQATADAASWSATFTAKEIMDAAKTAGITVESLDSVEIGKKGQSGRAATILLGGKEVNAPDFRIALGSTKMRSTFLTELTLADGKVKMAGKGFGHGVGMSQWGAFALAQEGKKAEEIVKLFFQNVEVVKMY